MISKYIIILCFTFSSVYLTTQNPQKNIIFITSNLINCEYQKCDGSILNPYDSFFYAINTYKFIDNQFYSFIFLGNSTTTHYWMLSENFNGSIYYDYNNPNGLVYYLNISLEMKPLYCDDPDFDFTKNISLSSKCINKSEHPYINIQLKTDNFQFNISGNLSILNLHFDGNEIMIDYYLSHMNISANSSLLECSRQRNLCSNRPEFNILQVKNENINIISSKFQETEDGEDSIMPPPLDILGRFIFQINRDFTNENTPMWVIDSSTFKNIISASTFALFKSPQRNFDFEVIDYQLVCNNTNFEDIYFYFGIFASPDWFNDCQERETDIIALKFIKCKFSANEYPNISILETTISITESNIFIQETNFTNVGSNYRCSQVNFTDVNLNGGNLKKRFVLVFFVSNANLENTNFSGFIIENGEKLLATFYSYRITINGSYFSGIPLNGINTIIFYSESTNSIELSQTHFIDNMNNGTNNLCVFISDSTVNISHSEFQNDINNQSQRLIFLKISSDNTSIGDTPLLQMVILY